MTAYIVFLGAPGSGKGTQSKLLSHEISVPNISTGDLIRKHIDQSSLIGLEAIPYIQRGELVPDSLIFKLFSKEIKPKIDKGFILDGFPRTLNQMKFLNECLDNLSDKLIPIHIDVPITEIIRRISGRRTCKHCNHTIHVDKLDNNTYICKNGDECEFFIRQDDTPDLVKLRFQHYNETIDPVLKGYGDKLVSINGSSKKKDIFEDILRLVQVA